MSNPILIDSNNLIVRCIMCSAMDDLKANGTWTGGIFGSVNSLVATLNRPEVDPGPIYAFFDAGVPAARMAALPGYKEKRKEKRKLLSDDDHEKAMGQLHATREIFEMLGIPCLAYKDREADDCVAAAVRWCLVRGHKPIVLSNDRDMLQTVAWGARVWNGDTHTLIDQDNFEEVTGIPPKCYLFYRLLRGDSTDEITGAVGCGEKKAPIFIKTLNTPRGALEEKLPDEQLSAALEYVADLGDSAAAWQKVMLQDEKRLRRTLKGIDLWDSWGSFEGMEKGMASRPPLQIKPFMQRCAELKFRSIQMEPERYLGPFRKAAIAEGV